MDRPEALPKTIGMDPITRYVRSLKGDWRMLSEVSHQVGVSQFTLRRFIRENEPKSCLPSKIAQIGKVVVYLYSPSDIARIEKHLESRKKLVDFTGKRKVTGRPAVYTKEQRAERKKLRARVWYWTKRAEELQAQGDIEGMEDALATVAAMKKELENSAKG